MSHDFAKIRPEPLLERKPVDSPPAWSLMITGMVVGLAIGVFACVLFYLSGNVPPLNSSNPIQSSMANLTPDDSPVQVETPAAKLQLEFYRELPNYEVTVDATPVELTPEQAGQTQTSDSMSESLPAPYMLQTGAFQQQDRAYLEMERLQTLGLDVLVKSEQLPGRILYLVQSGPYSTTGQLNAAEQILRRNNIPSWPISLQ
ncbi:MAG: SPOR domain-containing protein [Proteobacteria bacterium]|nr:SPOR domain-containing protein [Pseudomonadota bacterium]